MKKNWLLFSTAVLFLSACQINNNSSTSDQQDSLNLIGGQKDTNDCLTSAGYSWSQLKKDCIRPFEDGIPLYIMNAAQSYQGAAYLLIDSASNKAEIFVPEEYHSIVLESKDQEHFSNGKFDLIKEDFCWTLTLNKNKLYQEQK